MVTILRSGDAGLEIREPQLPGTFCFDIKEILSLALKPHIHLVFTRD
jgi:hypothetical protein